MKNIIFLTHAENNPSGGGKVIYRHSQIIDKFKNFSSEVVHIKKKKLSKFKNSINKKFSFQKKTYSGWKFDEITYVKNFRYNWFENAIKIKQNFQFDNQKDFIILPEIFAHLADDLLIKKKIDYAIFVQNGYIINSTNDEQKLLKAYKNAKFIISISGNTSDCIRLKFPNLKTKILKVSHSIDLGHVNFNKKKNIITYMNRKLPQHSNLVLSYLSPYLTKNWQIKNLQNLSEKQTYEILKKSKIFLSFSSLEGLGLPPIEAALAGNYVIGYTGEGGNEYWQKPFFNKINSGEINNFVSVIIDKINEKKSKKINFKTRLNLLKKKFSKERELNNIKKYLRLV